MVIELEPGSAESVETLRDSDEVCDTVAALDCLPDGDVEGVGGVEFGG